MAKVSFSMLCLAVLAGVVLSCTSSEAHPRRNHHNKLIREHLKRVYGFKCREPQQRIVNLEELGVTVDPAISYYPRVTVLNKCDCQTGYCTKTDEVCGVDESQPVELVFRITNEVAGGEPKYWTVNATNHISCSCKPRVTETS